jgi:NADH-quinone oxidoreductase subunit M
MNPTGGHLLTVLTFLPLAGALLLLFIPHEEKGQLRVVAFVTSLVGFGLSIPLVLGYDPKKSGMQFEETHAWVPQLGITYHLGVDGIAVVLILLTTFLSPIVILSTFGSIHTRVKELMIALLVLQTAMVGTFASLDMILFYVFWELMLVPMYLLVGVWGSENRIYAAVKLFIYTAFGSLLMLVAIIYLYWQTKTLHPDTGPSFAYADFLELHLTAVQQAWLFGAFALAFAIKVPLFPLHTWLPDAHVQAPAAGSVVLAGVLLKMGTYGFVRYAMPLFPEATETYAPVLGWLAVIGIVYGSLMSMAQTDMKKLIAYSSVAHLGFVMMGLMSRTPESTDGAVLQMINHGISTGALFLLIGYMYDRRHTRDIANYGGQAKATPMMAIIFLVVTLSSIGLPSTNGFVGEFLILIGTFASPVESGRAWAVIGASGVILGAVYMLTLYQKAYLGSITNPEVSATKDLNARELTTLAPLLAAIVLLGIFPQPILDIIHQPVTDFIVRTSPSLTAGTGTRTLPTPHQIQPAKQNAGGAAPAFRMSPSGGLKAGAVKAPPPPLLQQPAPFARPKIQAQPKSQ